MCCLLQRLLAAYTISVLLFFTMRAPILLLMPKCPTEIFALSDSLTVIGGHKKNSGLGHIKRSLTEISGRVFAFLIKELPFHSSFLLSSS